MAPDDRPLEVELKLAATAEAIDTLIDAKLLNDHAEAPAVARDLVTIYYDTPDRRLSRRKLALRVRRVGRRHIQTLKTANESNGASLRRGEWEVELEGSHPDLAAFGDPAVLELTGLVLPDELEPVYETRFKRRALTVSWAAKPAAPALIEVAFDQGRIQAGSHRMPLSEIELELKSGSAAPLFEVAEALRGVAPLRLQTQDKSARGHALAAGTPPEWRKADSVGLHPGMRVDDAVHAILGGCVRHWLDNEAATADARDPEGLHQLRVALRRLRSAMSLMKPAISPPVRDRWNDELRWLLGPLGPARDLDVFVTETLAPVREANPDDPDLGALIELAEDRRAQAHHTVRETLASERYGDLAFTFACWVGRSGWCRIDDIDARVLQREPITGFADAILAKRYRKARKQGRGFEHLAAEDRHELRIAMKKLRYGAEFFGDLYPGKDTGAFRKAASRMQDVLGHMNDVAVARHVVDDLLEDVPSGARQRSAALGAGQVIGWYKRQAQDLEPEARELWRAFRSHDPFWNAPDET
ncbi:CYTH and CHAD domain-containing protein [Marinivivus vitaminiproducens]|uniref:CYTH and CHAD domain-containing protein n=1 Tax=Marinivivus vitaminiproducens TaxID=3035935 RepID=UPI0027A03D60|nr:CHAD domain-containing protein [Geminicoccaceae bacterium SCSIO 64248]